MLPAETEITKCTLYFINYLLHGNVSSPSDGVKLYLGFFPSPFPVSHDGTKSCGWPEVTPRNLGVHALLIEGVSCSQSIQ
jgi:hypothetical protein